MFTFDRAASNSPSLTLGLPSAIDLALAFTGGGCFDYILTNNLPTAFNQDVENKTQKTFHHFGRKAQYRDIGHYS
jgi:hypothetical protein